MTAREKFSRGDRIFPSAHALATLWKWRRHPPSSAMVVGFGKHDVLVRVRRDGLKSIESYHMDFWERAA